MLRLDRRALAACGVLSLAAAGPARGEPAPKPTTAKAPPPNMKSILVLGTPKKPTSPSPVTLKLKHVPPLTPEMRLNAINAARESAGLQKLTSAPATSAQTPGDIELTVEHPTLPDLSAYVLGQNVGLGIGTSGPNTYIGVLQVGTAPASKVEVVAQRLPDGLYVLDCTIPTSQNCNFFVNGMQVPFDGDKVYQGGHLLYAFHSTPGFEDFDLTAKPVASNLSAFWTFQSCRFIAVGH